MQELTKSTIHLATNNMNKFEEIRNVLENSKINLRVINIKGNEIQAFSVLSVARQSALNIAEKFEGAFLVEDSGLYIDSLYGFPGPYSSFVYKTIGVGGIIRLIKDRENKNAEFHSALIYGENGKIIKNFVGITEGTISTSIKGKKGFGFDPIFIPNGYNKTFAEMSIMEKNKISHRAKSTGAFAQWITKKLDNT